MNVLRDVQWLGRLLLGLAAAQLVPTVAALAWGEPALPYLVGAIAAAGFGLPIAFGLRPEDQRMRTLDTFVLACGAWGLSATFGAIPYLTSGALAPIDAIYEATAGFTTTASSTLASVEAAPRALVLWRSMTQWLGGAGVLVVATAVLPFLGIGGVQLFASDTSRSTAAAGRARVVDSSKRLLGVYAGLTGLGFVALLAVGLGGFDAICHALTSVSTGGFSTRDGSIGSFGSAGVEWTVIGLMFLGATSFVLLYRGLTGRVAGLLRDAELRYYVAVLAVAAAAIAWTLQARGDAHSIRTAVFQAVSMLSGAGYYTQDYRLWGGFAQIVLLALAVVGGMSGSTTGGIKSVRLRISLHSLRDAFTRLLHPHAIRSVKYGGRSVPDDVIAAIWAFLTAYFAIVGVAAALVASAGTDLVTAASLAFSLIANVGPALGAAGPGTTVAEFPAYVKLGLCGCMLAGRLDVFTLIVLVQPKLWRR